jgi:hypothetical protein
MFAQQPLVPKLSGLALEYRIVQLYSRDAGEREAELSVEYVVSGGSQPRRPDAPRGQNEVVTRSKPVKLTFDCAASHEVTFRVADEHAKPTTAAFLSRDKQGRVYPSQAKRLAPDFAFQPQIYRGDGEKLKLPAGTYTVVCSRGPESIPETKTLTVGDDPPFSYQVRRWVDPTKLGWYSGDHHIHAAGCAHYSNPTEGVHAEDMIRHCLGEDLKVGCNLTWGPCFDYQLQFFTGKATTFRVPSCDTTSKSCFGSHAGPPVPAALTERNYPGGESNTHRRRWD